MSKAIQNMMMTTAINTQSAYLKRPIANKSDKDSGIYSEITHSCSSMASNLSSSIRSSTSSATSGHKQVVNNQRLTCPVAVSTRQRAAVASVSSQTSSSSAGFSVADDDQILYDAERNSGYEKLHLIGKGGFASVYQVRAVGTDEVLAAKVIDKRFLEHSQQRSRVRNEINIHSTVSGHPNILEFRGSFKSGDHICILSEICTKSNLVQYMRKGRNVSESEIARIFLQIVRGVKHLHGMGVIHRDLKLANILQTADRQVKIGDFGLAVFAEEANKNSVCGTPNFIAPEVLRKEGHSFKSDIWSLGCLLFGLLVGRYPFAALSIKETYKRISRCRYNVPSCVSSEASDLLRLLLNPDPSQRPTPDQMMNHAFFAKYDGSRKSSSSSSSRKNSEKDQNPSRGSGSQDSESKPVFGRLCDKIKRIASTGSSRKGSETASETSSTRQGPKSVGSATNTAAANNVGVYVTYWVDYSNRYGFGYRLSDGKICVLFNDGKHLSLFPNSRMMEYFPTEKCEKGIRFNIGSSPAPLHRYIRSFAKIAEYLEDAPTVDPSQVCTATTSSTNNVRLMTWVRNDDCVLMYLNNRTLQFKFFPDGQKMLITNIHKSKMALRFIEKDEKNTVSVSAPSAVQSAPASVRARLTLVHQLFHDKLFNVTCDLTHPFCDVIAAMENDH